MAKEEKGTHKGHKEQAAKQQLSFEDPEKKPIPTDDAAATEEVAEISEAVEAPEVTTPVKTESVSEVQPETTEEAPTVIPEETASVQANTHSKNRRKEKKSIFKLDKRWTKIAGLTAGIVTLLALVVCGGLSQYFTGKVMPGVSVAHIASTAKNPEELKQQLNKQKNSLKITLTTDGKSTSPKFDEIGFEVNVDKTVTNALKAKRGQGLFTRLAFWKHVSVPAVVTVNDSLLNQYVETHNPELSKAPQDAQLQFDTKQSTFVITDQADGQGPNMAKLKQGLNQIADNLQTKTINLTVSKKGPTITQAKLQPLLDPANQLISRRIILTGLGFTYQARPADIASWITPTPQENGSVKLIVDSAKVQSYVDTISKKISSPPVDKKVIKDDASGAEVVLQQGKDGTELADKQTLAVAIAAALKNQQDTTQNMNITTAAYKTVNMNAYDKWIEVDLSEQRTTAYEKATPVKVFSVATGVRGHDTPVGEYAIWLKVRSQTMQGGSKADGSFYNIPNVEWVSYFYQDYALHGAWWRKQFGAPASHGCVNMTNDDAQWVYEWAPVGTKVIVHA